MKNKLEEQMSELMDTASLKELMPDFDQEALWEEVAARLPEQAKRKAIPIWWIARAAAVLLVVIATWTVLHFSGNKSVDPIEITQAKPSQISPLKSEQDQDKPVVREEIAVTNPTQNPAHATVKNTSAGIKPETPEAASATQVLQDIAGNPVAPVLGTPAGQNMAVAAVKKKVTHYLDIDDDMPANATPAVASNPSFIQVKLNKPGLSEQQSQTKPFKELVFALAR